MAARRPTFEATLACPYIEVSVRRGCTYMASQTGNISNNPSLWPLFLTFDSWRKGRTKRSQWTLLIYGSRRTIWHLNLWNRLKLKIGSLFDLFLTFDPWRKGRTKRSPWTLLIYDSRRTIWHLNLGNRLKLTILPLFLTFVTPRSN